MAEVARENEHFTRVILFCGPIDGASLVLEHVLQVELLADHGLAWGLPGLFTGPIPLGICEHDAVLQLEALLALASLLCLVLEILQLLEVWAEYRLEGLDTGPFHKVIAKLLIVAIVLA